MEVRDPIHGAIAVSDDEIALVDDPYVQRLRGIKQMGFSELPFPGAVHSRYAHALGVMELAGRAFDAVFRERDPFTSTARRALYRSLVRVAALCHDLGHAPFSHCTEFAMPPLRALRIAAYEPRAVAHRLDRAASHEDYTILLLTQSALAETIARGFPFTGRHVAALVSREVAAPDDLFIDGGRDYRRVLSQLISSELDVDRLDYLVRDSYYSGARYGEVDVNWILSNLEWQEDDAGAVGLALDHRAIYAFDDFMIARFHMFVQVYFHHKSVVYEEMLKRHFTGPACAYAFPNDAEGYLPMDDVHLHAYLRRDTDDWARRIRSRQPYRRALELHGTPDEVDLTPYLARLTDAGIDALAATSTGKLSRYAAMGRKREGAPRIAVVQRSPGTRVRVMPLENATRIFERYQDERHIARLYVGEDVLPRARALVESVR
jgi:HD superfamily phosphohydrolase